MDMFPSRFANSAYRLARSSRNDAQPLSWRSFIVSRWGHGHTFHQRHTGGFDIPCPPNHLNRPGDDARPPGVLPEASRRLSRPVRGARAPRPIARFPVLSIYCPPGCPACFPGGECAVDVLILPDSFELGVIETLLSLSINGSGTAERVAMESRSVVTKASRMPAWPLDAIRHQGLERMRAKV